MVYTYGSLSSGTTKTVSEAQSNTGRTYRMNIRVEKQPLSIIAFRSNESLEKEATDTILNNLFTNYPGCKVRYIKVDIPRNTAVVEFTMPTSAGGYSVPGGNWVGTPYVAWIPIAIIVIAIFVGLAYLAYKLEEAVEVIVESPGGTTALSDIAKSIGSVAKYGVIGIALLGGIYVVAKVSDIFFSRKSSSSD